MARIQSTGYYIETGSKALSQIGSFLKRQQYSGYFVLCDENTLQHCLPRLVTSCAALKQAHIIEIESGESSKSLEFCAHIWQTLAEQGADRSALIVNLGGGVVSDVGGFCAAVYKRGIDFINVPTSLLAMADASVGGKTGIDFSGHKNFIGTFTQPKAVFVDPLFLRTLPQRHLHNGMAEIYKIALVSDKKLWERLKQIDNKDSLIEVVERSIILKNRIVRKDPFDKGLRRNLNFGHTIGHAIESLLLFTPEELLHGEAVYMGMLVESHIAWQKKLISKNQLREVEDVLLACTAHFNLHQAIETEKMMALARNDKKNRRRKFMFSLLNDIGACRHNVSASEEQIVKALLNYNLLAQ